METLSWKTELRKVAELKAYENNPRQISEDMFEKLKGSIKDMGYVELVAIDADNTIIAGHMRVRALIELGRGEEMIEVRVPSRKLTKKEFERYLIQSNKVTGSFNFDSLANNFSVEELTDWGFTESELGMGEEDDEEEGAGGGSAEPKTHKCPKCGHEFTDEKVEKGEDEEE